MAIKFPESVRNTTSGALRQARETGSSTNGGGLFSSDYIAALMSDESIYLKKTEPLGKHMSALEKATQHSQEMTEALSKQVKEMIRMSDEAGKQLASLSGKIRDGAEKMASAMEKINKVTGGSTFFESVQSAASLVDSLERLAKLQETGVLENVMAAMSAQGKKSN